MYKKLTILIVGLIALGLMIGLPFSFNNDELVKDTAVLVFYIISKSIFGLIFIFAVIWSVLQERARGAIALILLVATLLQGFPPLCRASLFMGAFTLPFNILVLAFGLIGFTVLFMMNHFSSAKQLEADQKYVGKEIPVQEEKDILDTKGE